MSAQAATNVVGRIEREVLLTLDVGFDGAANVTLRQTLDIATGEAYTLAGTDDLVLAMLEKKVANCFKRF